MRQILEKIITEGFDNQRWISFFREKNETCWRPRGADLSGYNTTDFTNGEKIGEYDFEAGKKIIISAFFSKKSLSERSGKLAQYKIGKDVLTGKGFDAGIFIFSDENNNFRFSYIETNYLGIKRDFTHFRRFTYFVSKEFTNKTFLQMIGDEDFGTVVKIKGAFSVEKVTKKFYEEYHQRFEALSAELNKNRIFSFVAEKNRIKYDDFAKKLLGQIVFLYFIQKKGWLGVPKNEKWGSGDRNFMSKLYKRAEEEERNFYNDFLEPLFYDTLNNSRRNSADPSFSKLFNSRVPFLNGGLFEPEYDWEETSIRLDNSIFKNILETFDRFNFTIEEESPDDKEVAIDPEMLGKVFENLLNENLRKGKGTYYTPREIVYYMCKESLINYLIEKTAIDEKKIRKLVTGAEIVRDSVLVGIENESQEKMLEVAEKNLFLNKKEGEKIDGALKEIKVVDPACGSGAFLVGMLNEIVRCRLYLSDWILRLNKKEYELKKETIQNCIYGVDIDPGAVDIAKLRLWLSLVVEHNFDEIEPLPNLDYRIMCGNSLLEEFEGVKFYGDIDDKTSKTDALFADSFATDYREKSKKLQNKIKEYFALNDRFDKKKKQKEINDLKDWLIRAPLERQKNAISKRNEEEKAKTDMMNKKSREKYLAQFGKDFSSEINIKMVLDNLHNPKEAKPFFLWKLEFIDVFEEKGGFDVVIANPPYVRADSPDFKAQREAIMQSKLYETLYEKWDLFLPFIERGLKLLSDFGNLSYITSNSLLTSKFAFLLLEFVQKNYAVQYIDYFNDDTKVFEAGVVPVVFGIARNAVNPNVRKTIHQGEFNHVIKQETVPLSDFKALGKNAFKLSTNSFKSTTKAVSLGDICYMSKGMVLNADEKTAQGDFAKDDLISDVPSRIHTKGYIEGKNIDYFSIKRTKFLEWNTERVPRELSRATFIELYDRPKIMRGRVTGGIYDDTGLVCNDSIVVFVRFIDLAGVENKSISGSLTKSNSHSRMELEKISAGFNLKYLLAILNSKFANNFLNGIRRHRLKNYFYPDDFRQLPIADIPIKEQKPFIEIVDKILATTSKPDYDHKNPPNEQKVLESKIDQMVYKLYLPAPRASRQAGGLTPEEIKIVEGAGD